MLTLTATSTAGPQRKTDTEKHVHILRISADRDATAARRTDTEIGLNTSKPDDLPKVNDIVVFDHKPWHYARQMLRPHPQVHRDYPETVLQLARARNESAVWWSEEPFTILKVALHSDADGDATHGGAPHGHPPAAAAPPDNPHFPFTQPLATVVEDDGHGTKLHVVRSTVPVKEADHRTFKITFTIHGEPEPIDPDMHCEGKE